MKRSELTFDGFGINGPDEYRSRVATFTGSAKENGQAEKYGPLFAQAPAMAERVEKLEAACNRLIDAIGPDRTPTDKRQAVEQARALLEENK